MRIPVATYRLQLNSEFTFADAVAVSGYLDELGITDVYTSPLSAARPGSMHGYDVIDHGVLNPELGGEAAFRALSEELRGRNMGLLLDVVPNHMCIAADENRRWLEVLENGPSAVHARFFDVDWRPPKPELTGKVLLPVLGEQYGRVLEEGIAVFCQDGAFGITYDHTRLPLAPRSWPHLLAPALADLRRRFGDEDFRVLELESIIRAIGYLPARTDTAPAKLREREHESTIIRRRLAALIAESPDARTAIDEAVRDINGREGDPRSFDRLEALLAEQAYRLSHWRVAAHEINYRRFFDINDLAAIRVEDPVVFAAVHKLPFRLAREGVVTGLRVDHVDGLFDPEKYLLDLQRGFRNAMVSRTDATQDGYVVVEKILAPDERLPSEWPVQGTTGYDFLNLVSGVLIDPTAGPRMRELAARSGGADGRFSDIVYRSKKLVLGSAMAAELVVLARRLDRISEQHRYTRDFTLSSLHDVLSEVIACFPVYRTYIRPDDTTISDRDRLPVEIAIRVAKRRNPVTNESLFDFVRALLLLQHPEGLTDAQRAERRDFVLRFQQLTGPVMAKGLEDTAFYRYFPLAALNEVGGDPDAFGASTDEFHRRNAERARSTPHGLSATATHDTKRGEDTRARLLVLSEIPEAWEAAVDRWRELNRVHKTDVGGTDAPVAGEEYLLYQTLVGTWPLDGAAADPEFVARVQNYMRKALLEAKVHTSWINRNEPHEEAVHRFVEAVLDPGRNAEFLADFANFHEPIARAGFWNGLAQLLLKIASPGVPDFYQGTELWDFSLVDPDNRRPVDYTTRHALLASLRRESEHDAGGLADRLVAAPEDGRIKMFVALRALQFRRRQRAVFEHGGYQRITVAGQHESRVVAFARTHESGAAIAVVSRHVLALGDPPIGKLWGDTKLLLPDELARRTCRDVLTNHPIEAHPEMNDRELPVSELLAHLPVAMVEVR